MSRGPYAGRAALTSRVVGAGTASYLGWLATVGQAGGLVAHLVEGLEIERLGPLPPGLVARRRGDAVVLLNFTDAPLGGARWPAAG